jgi:hypothetical protein
LEEAEPAAAPRAASRDFLPHDNPLNLNARPSIPPFGSNIEGFTNALAGIVAQRGRKSGFQLVVISHDDEFIQVGDADIKLKGAVWPDLTVAGSLKVALGPATATGCVAGPGVREAATGDA